MALSTYSELQTAIATWAWMTGETTFEAAVPDFITLCESKLNRTLRVRDMEASATIDLTNGVGALPSDYLEFREVKTTRDPPDVLHAVEPGYGDHFYGSAESIPQFFSIIGSNIHVYPPSDDNLTMRYYQEITALSDAAPTNWLLTKAPEVYLYGSLIATSPFQEDDNRLNTWMTLYNEAIDNLKREDSRSRYVRASVRVKGPTP